MPWRIDLPSVDRSGKGEDVADGNSGNRSVAPAVKGSALLEASKVVCVDVLAGRDLLD